MRTMANRLMMIAGTAVLLSVASPARAASGSGHGLAEMVESILALFSGEEIGEQVSQQASHQSDSKPGSSDHGGGQEEPK